MIKEYGIVYEVLVPDYKIEDGVYKTSFNNFNIVEARTIRLHGKNIKDVIIYATNQLELENIKEVFEL